MATLRTCDQGHEYYKVAIVQLAQPVRKRESQKKAFFLFFQHQQGER
ncbi:hypothetical protein ABH955_002783 [Bacillus sp. RC240]